MYIIGDGFIIRDYRLDDIPRLQEIADNYNIYINLAHTFPHPYTLKDAEWWVNHNISLGEKSDNFVVEIDGQFAGGCGIRYKGGDQGKTWDIGYWLGEQYRGKGFATKVCKTLIEYGFTIYDTIRIEASVFGWNPASMHILEKNGFVREGRLRNRIWKDGKVTDEVIFSILKEEYTPTP